MTEYTLDVMPNKVYQVGAAGYTANLEPKSELTMYSISYSPLDISGNTNAANALYTLTQGLPLGYLWSRPRFERGTSVGYVYIEGLMYKQTLPNE